MARRARGGGAPGRRQPRLSDEQRKELWRKAVMVKAKQLKNGCDVAILVMLLAVLGAHALPFVKGGKIRSYDGYGESFDIIRQQRGYKVVLNLLLPYRGSTEVFGEDLPYWKARLAAPPGLLWGVQPRVVYTHHRESGDLVLNRYGKRWEKKLKNVYPASVSAYLLLAVSLGAVVVLLLYLLDYVVWMGRALPALSFLYGFGSVIYLMVTKQLPEGAWNALQYGSALAWYLLLIPLFLMGTVSLLRFVVSQRWKRYVFAGLPIPEHLKPEEKTEEKAEEGKAGEKKAEKKPEKKPEKKDEPEKPAGADDGSGEKAGGEKAQDEKAGDKQDKDD